jgi:hypothetical protein
MNTNEFKAHYKELLRKLTTSELEKLYWDVQIELDLRDMMDRELRLMHGDTTGDSKL